MTTEACSVIKYLERMALDHHGDVAVEALKALLIQTL